MSTWYGGGGGGGVRDGGRSAWRRPRPCARRTRPRAPRAPRAPREAVRRAAARPPPPPPSAPHAPPLRAANAHRAESQGTPPPRAGAGWGGVVGFGRTLRALSAAHSCIRSTTPPGSSQAVRGARRSSFAARRPRGGGGRRGCGGASAFMALSSSVRDSKTRDIPATRIAALRRVPSSPSETYNCGARPQAHGTRRVRLVRGEGRGVSD